MKGFASSVAVAFAAIASMGPVSAQERVFYTHPGRPVAIAEIWNCFGRSSYQGVSGAAHNGSVVAVQAIARRCGKAQQPVMRIIYTPSPGFRGRDEATLYGTGVVDRRKIVVQ